jgi:hypothetical protein
MKNRARVIGIRPVSAGEPAHLIELGVEDASTESEHTQGP